LYFRGIDKGRLFLSQTKHHGKAIFLNVAIMIGAAVLLLLAERQIGTLFSASLPNRWTASAFRCRLHRSLRPD
jgi:hypothetical protein